MRPLLVAFRLLFFPCLTSLSVPRSDRPHRRCHLPNRHHHRCSGILRSDIRHRLQHLELHWSHHRFAHQSNWHLRANGHHRFQSA
uniref:Putative secreted protein n=1 Tax=Anopheles marajoara TaxID=58244 RepID=A0A2M4CAR0_9DIPT